MTDSTWPPSVGLSTPTVAAKDAVFNTASSTRINAPASLVYDIVLNVAEYPQWNTFVPEVKILSQPDGSGDDKTRLQLGSIMTFMVVMDSKKPTKYTPTELQVTDMSTPEKQSSYISEETRAQDGSFAKDLSRVYRVTWKQHGGYASKGLKTERFHEIIVISDNECELRTWEVYGGVLANAVKWMYQKTLNDKFALWCNDLKQFAEQKAGSATTAVAP